jgi:hypothetical protein
MHVRPTLIEITANFRRFLGILGDLRRFKESLGCAAVRCTALLDSVRQCARGCVRQCTQQCAAVRVAVMCGSAYVQQCAAVLQCTRQCAAVRQCGNVRLCAAVRMRQCVCGSAPSCNKSLTILYRYAMACPLLQPTAP